MTQRPLEPAGFSRANLWLSLLRAVSLLVRAREGVVVVQVLEFLAALVLEEALGFEALGLSVLEDDLKVAPVLGLR